jgi:NADPH-dependent curcumin reductase CurA
MHGSSRCEALAAGWERTARESVMQSREVRLRRRPEGLPRECDFELVTVPVPEPGSGEVLVRNLWMSVDPAMRGRMSDARSYRTPYALGSTLEGPAIGEVLESNVAGFARGDLVRSESGWREVFVAAGDRLGKLDTAGLPPQAHLGIAGLTGFTAYVGLKRIAELRDGDEVFVSAASGAVGSAACQFAKILGHRVVGSAGGAHKVAWLRDELGLDAAIDYKAVPSLTKALAAAAPRGIDVYFDNVGGDHLQAAIAIANRFARFALCGMISQYNLTSPPSAPHNLMLIMGKALKLQGYIVSYHEDLRPAFRADLARWHSAGQLRWRETVLDGIENAPAALIGLFEGRNLGKMLVRLG